MSRSRRAAPSGPRATTDPARPGSAAGPTGPTGAAPPYAAVVIDSEALLAGAPERPRLSPEAVDLVRRLRLGAVPVALVTPDGASLPGSETAMDAAFTVVLRDGAEMESPVFAEAASRLSVAVPQVAVVSGTLGGVRKARTAGFGLVVGILRTGASREDLEAAGADFVLDDVGELDLGVLRADPWVLAYEGFDPAHEGHREALTTLGNGYLGTRGAAPEHSADGVHYPGTYLAGVYNRLTSRVQGRTVEDEHLVNAPNWLPLDLRIEDGQWWSDGGSRPCQERRELDLRQALLTRHLRLVDAAGRVLEVVQRRLVSMQHPHLAALETVVIPRGWSGRLGIRSGIDAAVTNSNVTEYAGLASRHLGEVTAREVDGVLLVEAVTTTSRITIATAARTEITGCGELPTPTLDSDPAGRHSQRFEILVRDGEPVRIDKTVAVTTSRDRAIAGPGRSALDQLQRYPSGVRGLLPGHEAAWNRLWRRFHVGLDTDRQTQLVLNLHVFHVLQTISPHTAELDAGVTARGLHGEGYRGHVFWDELFVQPLITMRLPAVTRALLDYRWHRLDAARAAARQAGLRGALFPWQSGSDGREETPTSLFNPRSRRWMPDNSRRQRHVGLAVAYNAWQYYQATGDTAWLAERGADLIIEVTRLFAALAAHDPADDRFHIAGVMGPDEYHDGYPDAPGDGLRDNAYTNVLTAWLCHRALDTLATLAGHACEEVFARLAIDDAERIRWAHMAHRLAVPFHDGGVISQFDGYDRLAELDWDRYRSTYGNIGRLDLILEAEGGSTNRYRLAKQADVLMLIYLLGPDELLAVLRRLGYRLDWEGLRRTIDYYLSRTAHGSTLCRVVHASVLARFDPAQAWTTFRDALVADLDDTQGGTTREGIHLGAMAGTVDMVIRSFAGVSVHHGRLSLRPRLPDALRQVGFQLQYRGQCIDLALDHMHVDVAAHPCAAAPPVTIQAVGSTVTLQGGEHRTVQLTP